jgi:hypothetical protein
VILKLGADGAFKDKIVALAVCGEGGEMAFNTHLIREAGAKAVLFYDRMINAQAVESVLLEFTQLLMREGVPDGQFRSLWQRSIAQVLKHANDAEAIEVRKLSMVLFQVAKVEAPHLDAVA